MRQLDFMIIGVQKAGTTALASFLSEHPDIAVASGKEVHLFDSPEYVPSWSGEKIDAVYASRFKEQNEKCLLGEATPIYTYFYEIPECLAAYNSKLKLIMLLRDPTDRAISQYWMERGRGDESQRLLVAFLLEPFRLLWDFFNQTKRAQGSNSRVHSYTSRGHYTAQINNVLKYFPINQLLIVDSDALLIAHHQTMGTILQFLGASVEHTPPQKRVFTGDYPEKAHGFVRRFLDLYFGLERRRLRKLLPTLNHVGEWHWLGGLPKHNSDL